MIEAENPGVEQSEENISREGIFSSLDILTSPDVKLQFAYSPSKFGAYIFEEETLSDEEKSLLHGRAFVLDKVPITAISSGSPDTFYLAYDRVQGLVVPARSLSVENHGPSEVYYRWTDDGEKWTSWITLEDGMHDEYDVAEKVRFAEFQIYSLDSGTVISLRATR